MSLRAPTSSPESAPRRSLAKLLQAGVNDQSQKQKAAIDRIASLLQPRGAEIFRYRDHTRVIRFPNLLPAPVCERPLDPEELIENRKRLEEYRDQVVHSTKASLIRTVDGPMTKDVFFETLLDGVPEVEGQKRVAMSWCVTVSGTLTTSTTDRSTNMQETENDATHIQLCNLNALEYTNSMELKADPVCAAGMMVAVSKYGSNVPMVFMDNLSGTFKPVEPRVWWVIQKLQARFNTMRFMFVSPRAMTPRDRDLWFKYFEDSPDFAREVLRKYKKN